MIRWLLVAGAVCGLARSPAWAEGEPGSLQAPPSVQLIKPRLGRQPSKVPEVNRPHAGPVDERCRGLKTELETALRQQGRARKAFQAQLAHNAGTRLCREGQPEKGMAELRKGLSYLN